MDELPVKLRTEVCFVMHKTAIRSIKFLSAYREKDPSFVSWVANVLKAVNADEKEYIYKDGDQSLEGKSALNNQCSVLLGERPSLLCPSPL